MPIATRVYIGQIKQQRAINAHNTDAQPHIQYQWFCSCGETNSTVKNKSLARVEKNSNFWFFDSYSAAEQALDAHLHAHTREESLSVPNDPPNAPPTNLVQTHVKHDEGRPQDAPTTIHVANRVLDFAQIAQDSRWMLFTDDELKIIGRTLRIPLPRSILWRRFGDRVKNQIYEELESRQEESKDTLAEKEEASRWDAFSNDELIAINQSARDRTLQIHDHIAERIQRDTAAQMPQRGIPTH